MNVLSVDLEEWFHFLDCSAVTDVTGWGSLDSRFERSADWLISELHSRNVPCTFFCLGWIAERYPKTIRRIADLNYDIGSHGYYHQLVSTISRKSFYIDVYRSKTCIEQIIGARVDAYRAPGFALSTNEGWALGIIADAGYKVDSSLCAGAHVHGGFRGVPSQPFKLKIKDEVELFEVPLNTYRVFPGLNVYVGGGYFRLLPTFLLSHFLRKNDYNLTYFHPRDFDSEQPVLADLPWIRRFRSYVGLKNSRSKFKKLIQDFSFVDIETIRKSVDAKTFELIASDIGEDFSIREIAR